MKARGQSPQATPISAYGSRHANAPAAVRHLGIAKLRTITAPDQRREELIRVGSVQVDEGGDFRDSGWHSVC